MPRITQRERDNAKRAGRRPRYLCTWTDEHGRRCQRLAFTDKNAATRFELDQRERADRIRLGLIDPEQEEWREHGAADIATHLNAFERQLAVNGVGTRRSKPTPKYVDGVRKRLDRFVAWTGPGFKAPVQRLRDITMDRAIAWIDMLETDGWTTIKGKKKPYSGYSINEFIGALTMFTAWAEGSKRLSTDPLKGLGRRRTSRMHAERTHVRRSVSAEEIADLVRAAETRPLIAAQTFNRGPKKGQLGAKITAKREAELKRVGFERATLYLTLFWTGLRRSEAKALQWGDLMLDAEQPLARLRGHTTKAKRGDVLALHPELAERLIAMKQMRGDEITDTDAVFSRIPDRRSFGLDLDAAGIEANDGERYFDMHAIRVSLTTFLASQGVGQRLAQAHLRHSDPRLTAVTYTDAEALPMAATINRLPGVTDRVKDANETRTGAADETVEGSSNKLAAYRPLLNGRKGPNTASPVTDETVGGSEVASHKPLKGRDLSDSDRIGVRGFEPPTFSSRTRRATKLRYTPDVPDLWSGPNHRPPPTPLQARSRARAGDQPAWPENRGVVV